MEPVLQLIGISKRYGAARALDGVDLDVAPASVHALVGENGAGKSTLGMVIAGVVQADEGSMRFRGRDVRYRSPRDALADGVAVVRQELSLAPQLSVWQNVVLGTEPRRFGVLDPVKGRRRYEAVADLVEFDLPADARVGTLRLAEQQQVEILRALARDARLIVMDEPTSSLGARDAARLHSVVQGLRDDGRSVVYVSHFLEEVLRLADTVTVLRNGKRVRTASAGEETPARLVDAMLGRRGNEDRRTGRTPLPRSTAPVVSVRGLTRAPDVHDVSFDVRAGEVVALAGLAGSGRSEVARAIFGADRADAGEVRIAGAPVRRRSPVDAVRAGIAFVPESRKDDGLVMTSSQRANISLPHLRALSRWGVLARRTEREQSGVAADRVGVNPNLPDESPGRLSGGNQQKVLLAKWLFRRPRFLILDEPTRGVDVGARDSLHETIRGLALDGIPILLISSDLEELMHLANRVLVLHRGRIVAELPGPEFDEEQIVRASFGLKEAAA